MKRGTRVVNADAMRVGRMMARWAASGMNWGDGAHKAAVMAAGRRVLSGGAVAAEKLGQEFLAAEAAALEPGDARYMSGGHPTECWWQSPAAARVLSHGRH